MLTLELWLKVTGHCQRSPLYPLVHLERTQLGKLQWGVWGVP